LIKNVNDHHVTRCGAKILPQSLLYCNPDVVWSKFCHIDVVWSKF